MELDGHLWNRFCPLSLLLSVSFPSVTPRLQTLCVRPGQLHESLQWNGCLSFSYLLTVGKVKEICKLSKLSNLPKDDKNLKGKTIWDVGQNIFRLIRCSPEAWTACQPVTEIYERSHSKFGAELRQQTDTICFLWSIWFLGLQACLSRECMILLSDEYKRKERSTEAWHMVCRCNYLASPLSLWL